MKEAANNYLIKKSQENKMSKKSILIIDGMNQKS